MAAKRSKKNPNPHDIALLRLREVGLSYPEAHKKAPWPGHWDLAVSDKTFAYLSLEGEPLAVACKLPHSSEQALMLPGAKPTEYGLGKWGWVSISFQPDQAIPIDVLLDWLDESYRAQAPKKLVRQLDARAAPDVAKRKTAAKKKAANKKAPRHPLASEKRAQR